MGLSVFTYLGLLVFTLLAVLLALGLAVLLGVGPVATDTPVPAVQQPQAQRSGLDDAVRVAGSPGPALAAGQVAPGRGSPAGAGAPGPDAAPASATVAGVAVSESVPVAAPSRPAPGPAEPGPVSPAPTQSPIQVATEGPSAPPAAPPAAAEEPRLVANFEEGLKGWTAPGGERLPRLSGTVVRDGTTASVIRLSGTESSSRLILGGDGRVGAAGDALQIREGDEYAFGFSFYVESMVYGELGADNLIMRLRGEPSGGNGLGLQLWDFASTGWLSPARGLWSSGEAAGGPRFLGSIEERKWHDVVLHFRASAQGGGFYEIYLDGRLVDARQGVSLIPAGSALVQIEVGLFRDASRVQGTSEIRIDAAKLGGSLDAVLP